MDAQNAIVAWNTNVSTIPIEYGSEFMADICKFQIDFELKFWMSLDIIVSMQKKEWWWKLIEW